MMKAGRFIALGALVLAAGCVPRPEAPAPAPVPVRPPPPPPAAPSPPPVAAAPDWGDIPLTPGGWFYSSDNEGSQALFGPASSEARFIVRCDRSQRRVILSRVGAATNSQMAIRTSFGARNLPVAVQSGSLAYSRANLPASDPFLDSMVFSRGRITVEAGGLPMLVIPSWPEPARVIEDCRG
jgi:hypothetical protein